MGENEAIRLADAFESLKSNEAFRVMMQFLRDEVEKAKGAAVLTGADHSTETLRNRFIAWQEREKVVLAIDQMFEEHAETKRQIEEEQNSERAAERDRSTRANW